MSDIKERYISAVLRSIPEGRRSDVDRELRGAIEDAIEARVEMGEDPDDVVREVLTDLGDPDRLAADYADRPLWLIGPAYYFSWRRLTRRLLMFVPALAAVVVGLANLIGGGGVGSVFSSALGAAVTAAVNVLFWTTLGFAIAERADVKEVGVGAEWTPDQLPEVSDPSIPYGEVIGSLVVYALSIIGFFAQRRLTPEPLFDPAAWDLAIPILIGLFAVSAVFELIKLKVGRWTWPLAWINAALNAGFAAAWFWALFSENLLNPAFFDNWGMSGSLSTTRWIAAGVVLVICITDTVEGFVGARKTARAHS